MNRRTKTTENITLRKYEVVGILDMTSTDRFLSYNYNIFVYIYCYLEIQFCVSEFNYVSG